MAVQNNKRGLDRRQCRKQLVVLHCTRSVVWVELVAASTAFDRLVTEELARREELFESAELGFALRTQLRNYQMLEEHAQEIQRISAEHFAFHISFSNNRMFLDPIHAMPEKFQNGG